jgi:hypothetical protein
MHWGRHEDRTLTTVCALSESTSDIMISVITEQPELELVMRETAKLEAPGGPPS